LQYTELTDDPFVARLARYLPAARSTGEGMNRVNIPAWAIDLGKSRSGLCALIAESTALIVVDLQNAFLAPGETLANPHARDIVPNVNAIAQALRRRGGCVVFLRHTVSDDPRYKLTEWQARMDEEMGHYFEQVAKDWPEIVFDDKGFTIKDPQALAERSAREGWPP